MMRSLQEGKTKWYERNNKIHKHKQTTPDPSSGPAHAAQIRWRENVTDEYIKDT
jgi:hypothetical protein